MPSPLLASPTCFIVLLPHAAVLTSYLLPTEVSSLICLQGPRTSPLKSTHPPRNCSTEISLPSYPQPAQGLTMTAWCLPRWVAFGSFLNPPTSCSSKLSCFCFLTRICNSNRAGLSLPVPASLSCLCAFPQSVDPTGLLDKTWSFQPGNIQTVIHR